MINPPSLRQFDFLFKQTAQKKVQAQWNALELLFEKFKNSPEGARELEADTLYQKLRMELSPVTVIFPLSAVQKEIFYNDSGTAFIPAVIKKLLLKIKARFVVRPGSLEDLQKFVKFCHRGKIHYVLRGAGTWPFGGAVPVNQEIILDLSYLDFYELQSKERRLIVAPGVLFADMRKYLKERGFGLRQDITNPHSGTICGWVATGGLGLGIYKYGHVKESVEALLLLTPEGGWRVLTPEQEEFHLILGRGCCRSGVEN